MALKENFEGVFLVAPLTVAVVGSLWLEYSTITDIVNLFRQPATHEFGIFAIFNIEAFTNVALSDAPIQGSLDLFRRGQNIKINCKRVVFIGRRD